MMCAWQEFLSVLPVRLRNEVDSLGRESLRNLRLRINSPPELELEAGSRWLKGNVTQDELNFIVNAASRYSPWNAVTITQGFITVQGGHRIGICGEFIYRNGSIEGIRQVNSLCMRVARDFSGIAKQISVWDGSVIILGAPGWGKTTLLRDLVRQLSVQEEVCVVDEREELFPNGFSRGNRMDIITSCPKTTGIDLALRTMGPGWIAVDEITTEKDCLAIIQAANCGVRLAATAHAASVQDLLKRSVYKPLIEKHVFDTFVTLHKDKSYQTERLAL